MQGWWKSFIWTVIFLIFSLTFIFFYVRGTFLLKMFLGFENKEKFHLTKITVFLCVIWLKKQNKNRFKFICIRFDFCFKLWKLFSIVCSRKSIFMMSFAGWKIQWVWGVFLPGSRLKILLKICLYKICTKLDSQQWEINEIQCKEICICYPRFVKMRYG